MERMIRIFTENWRFSFIITAVIVIFGILSVPLLRREILPPVNFAAVSIQTVYPGASPEEVNDQITSVIEEELRSISRIKDIRSVSQNGFSDITVRIDIDADPGSETINEIHRAVSRSEKRLPPSLPDGPSVTEQKAKEIPVLEIAVTGGSPVRCRFRDDVAFRLETALGEVPGVAGVRSSGSGERQFQVIASSRRLAALDLGYDDLARALASRLVNIPAGTISDGRSAKLVRITGKTTSPEEIGSIIVRSSDAGHVVRIRDAADVIDCGTTPAVHARYNGRDAVLLTITKKEDADAVETVEKLLAAVNEFRKDMDEGFEVTVYRDAAEDIRERLGIVTFNAAAGFLVVLLVLFAFLPGRAGLASAISLPVSALGTVAFMVFLGADFNVITMVSLVICLGNLVDNSVVVSEYYIRLRERGGNGIESAIESAKQFWVPFTASTVTIVAAFLPMLVTKGVLGQFIKWIPVVVTIALCLSLLEALFLLPARLRFLDAGAPVRKKTSRAEKVFTALEDRFEALIALTLRRRKTTTAVLTLVVAASITLTVLFNRFVLFPSEGVEYYTARFSAAPGTALQVTDGIGAAIAREMENTIGKENTVSVLVQSGVQRSGLGDPLAKTGEHVGIITLRIRSSAAEKLDADAVIRKLQTIKPPSGCENISFTSQQAGPPVGKALSAVLRGNDHDELHAAVREFTGALTKIRGIRNAETDDQPAGKEYRLNMNESLAARAQAGFDVTGGQLRTAIEGRTIATLNDRGKQIDVVLKSGTRERSSIQELSAAEIQTARGALVPLNAIASFSENEAPRIRRNYNLQRAVTVTADVDTSILTSSGANSEARRIFTDIRKKNPSVSAVFSGEDEATRDSIYSLSIALLVALTAIFATLVLTFQSFRTPILVLSTIPLGLVGVMLSFTITRTPLGFMSFVGIVGLSGVVINSAIVLVDYIETLRKAKPKASIEKVVLSAARDRFRAVLATGLVTVIGLFPTAAGLGGYDAILVPITLALSWGVIAGTLLTLIWVPAGYVILYGKKR